MLGGLSRKVRVWGGKGTMRAYFSDHNSYIPVRPLKQDKNVLFTVGQPNAKPFITQLLTFTPLIGFSLEGLINQWSMWAMGGTFFGLIFAARATSYLNYYKAHQVFKLTVNKNITKVELTLPNNNYSKGWEELLFKVRKTTFERQFKLKLQSGKLNYPKEQLDKLKALEGEPLQKEIFLSKMRRREVVLELDMTQLRSFEMRSEKQIKKMVETGFRNLYTTRAKVDVFEDYSALKQDRKWLVIQTGAIDGLSLFFFANLPKNFQNKYQEYIKALVSGKKIVMI